MSATQTISAVAGSDQPTATGPVVASLGYLDRNHFRDENGVYRFFPGTAGSYRRPHDMRDVQIQDMRGHEEDFKLDVHGFQPIRHAMPATDISQEDKRKEILYPQTVELLKKHTGATDVHIYSDIVRLTPWEKTQEVTKNMQDSETISFTATAKFIHVDHSYDGAQDVFRDNLPAEKAARFQNHRWAIVNVWYPFNHAVTREPLAVADARSIDDKDLQGVHAKLPDKGSNNALKDVSTGAGFETWHLRYSPEHKWYYCSLMTPNECLMLKIFDSKKSGGVARRSPHTAFASTNDFGPPRNSVEVRCLVFWEDQDLE